MRRTSFAALVVGLVLGSCETPEPFVARPDAPTHGDVYSFASGCYSVDATEPGSENTRWLAANADGTHFAFSAMTEETGARFFLRASDLGTYLFFDADERYLVADGTALLREESLLSDVLLVDDGYRSPAEWDLVESTVDPTRHALRHHATGDWLTRSGALVDDESLAAVVALYPATGCAEFPELTLDADGAVEMTAWPDGDVYGFVEMHSHLFTNFGFGGGSLFHGSPFHRLGVEHALPSCEADHGDEGRRDLIGYGFSGLGDVDSDALLEAFISGEAPGPNHATDGYPTFTDWPNSWNSSTHQMQYWRWIERAYLAGMRLLVMHATTNQVLCEYMTGMSRPHRVRYSCDDMVAVEREIAETYALERYIDAQSGGPGRGWFHVVTSPEDARRVIADGHLAVILGIETSNLFDCFLTPRPGEERCDEARMREELDRFHALGVRAIFPVHKFDNAFSAGDGDRNVGQIGSFIQNGHWSNFVLDCPDVPGTFDHGDVVFGGLNMPRADYLAPAPLDLTTFADSPLGTLLPYVDTLMEPPLVGDYCQNAGLTPLGESLIGEMMLRGMIIEIDHLPRRSLLRAYELLEAADYPGVASHGNTFRGRLYDTGGMSTVGLGRCEDPARPGAMVDSLRNRVAEAVAHGAYPAAGFGFDLNGFAGGPRPRFGADATCGDVVQSRPTVYPFTSYSGDVTFTEPHLGVRTVDFDEEGMLHLGLVAELIDDARRTGATDADLEPLFRSAEGYLRMWERAESRAAAMR